MLDEQFVPLQNEEQIGCIFAQNMNNRFGRIEVRVVQKIKVLPKEKGKGVAVEKLNAGRNGGGSTMAFTTPPQGNGGWMRWWAGWDAATRRGKAFGGRLWGMGSYLCGGVSLHVD
ncbi:hypothetical protein ZWY2020_013929 [Hordeum vulgare]|nr:hypothetical protein ZWY2020_013929 [Hordeum vulgare]